MTPISPSIIHTLLIIMVTADFCPPAAAEASSNTQTTSTEQRIQSPQKTFTLVLPAEAPCPIQIEFADPTKPPVEIITECLSWQPDFHIAPDDTWILQEQKLGSGENDMYLFRIEPNGRVMQMPNSFRDLLVPILQAQGVATDHLYHMGFSFKNWDTKAGFLRLSFTAKHNANADKSVETNLEYDLHQHKLTLQPTDQFSPDNTASFESPQNHTVPDYTISPDGRYGVTIPTFEIDSPPTTDSTNRLIDLSTSRVLTVIQQRHPAYDRPLNHHGMAKPTWSDDSSLILWKVDGKWFYDSYILLKLNQGKVEWQRDLMELLQKEILTRTNKAAPDAYAKAKAANSENGEAYPVGFSVHVEAIGPVALPLKLRAALTSNPKSMPDHPNLDSYMFATLDETGNLHVTSFELGCADWSPFGPCYIEH